MDAQLFWAPEGETPTSLRSTLGLDCSLLLPDLDCNLCFNHKSPLAAQEADLSLLGHRRRQKQVEPLVARTNRAPPESDSKGKSLTLKQQPAHQTHSNRRICIPLGPSKRTAGRATEPTTASSSLCQERAACARARQPKARFPGVLLGTRAACATKTPLEPLGLAGVASDNWRFAAAAAAAAVGRANGLEISPEQSKLSGLTLAKTANLSPRIVK